MTKDRIFTLQAIFIGCLIVLLLALSIRFGSRKQRMNADSSYFATYGSLRTPGGSNASVFTKPSRRQMLNAQQRKTPPPEKSPSRTKSVRSYRSW